VAHGGEQEGELRDHQVSLRPDPRRAELGG
jgi:hypothetical protein